MLLRQHETRWRATDCAAPELTRFERRLKRFDSAIALLAHHGLLARTGFHLVHTSQQLQEIAWHGGGAMGAGRRHGEGTAMQGNGGECLL